MCVCWTVLSVHWRFQGSGLSVWERDYRGTIYTLLQHLQCDWSSSVCVSHQQSLFSRDSCAVARCSSALTLRCEDSGVVKQPSYVNGGGLSPSPLPVPSSSISMRPLLRLSLSLSSCGRTFLSSDSSCEASIRWSSLQRLLKRSLRGIHFVWGAPPEPV